MIGEARAGRPTSCTARHAQGPRVVVGRLLERPLSAHLIPHFGEAARPAVSVGSRDRLHGGRSTPTPDLGGPPSSAASRPGKACRPQPGSSGKCDRRGETRPALAAGQADTGYRILGSDARRVFP